MRSPYANSTADTNQRPAIPLASTRRRGRAGASGGSGRDAEDGVDQTDTEAGKRCLFRIGGSYPEANRRFTDGTGGESGKLSPQV